MMASKVFISYRRDDSAGHAGRVHDRLEREFGRDLLFMDVDSIPLGVNFVTALQEEVAKCGVLLAVIGRDWLKVRDKDGKRRLDNPDDFVRVEIAAALQRNIPVIPILLEGAKVPKANQLPKDLEELSVRNGLDVRHASFHNDMEKLIDGLKGQVDQAGSSQRKPHFAEGSKQVNHLAEPSPKDWKHQKPESIAKYYAQTESDFFAILNVYLRQANLAAGLYKRSSRSHRRWRFFEKFVPGGMASTSMSRGEQAAEARELLLSRYREYSSKWVRYVEAYGKTPTACINAGQLYRQLIDSDQELRQRIKQLTEVQDQLGG